MTITIIDSTPEQMERWEISRRVENKFLVGDGCWEWTGSKNGLGYGRITICQRGYAAHRVIYELFKGPIPLNHELDHLCRNPSCVKPDHLEPVTHAENMRRGLRGNLTTHCPRGHEYTEENTYRQPSRPASRLCRACKTLSNQTYVRRTPRDRRKYK